jgi:hypothetical protein
MAMVYHHIKYKEIHGVDEVVMMEPSEHKKLHCRLRKEGRCNIPSSILREISNRANQPRNQRVYHNRRKISGLRPDLIAAVI